MLFKKAAVLCFAGCGLARTLPAKLKPRQDATSTAGAPASQSTACGDIIAAVDDPEDSFSVFWSSDAYQCLTSVPFNPAVATRFLQYWNETIQFQSTLAYLKNPPAGYQQPAIDVQAELAKIQQRIDSDFYGNQYTFEADFRLLVYSINDGHVTLTGGALSAFTFASPFEIASVSVDGKQPPKIYFTADVIDSRDEGWTPSPIKSINGEDAIEYLTKFAALNAFGYVEPHAEWNALMSSPALDIQGGNTVFTGATFYPGENLTVQFENYTAGDDSTIWEDIWVAIYNELANYTGPLSTGGDFYNYFVLGIIPASFDPDSIIIPDLEQQEPATMNWSNASWQAYPEKPDVVQLDLGLLHNGLVSGYFYKDISTGVLSLPSFDEVTDAIPDYGDTVLYFIGNATQAGLDNIIIDLQQNSGGLTLLAYSIFRVFFPDLTPFGGSRRRIFPMANVLGSATTDFWDLLDEGDSDELTFKQEIAAYEWVITDRLNAATGKNFTSWEEYAAGPEDNGDTFSLTEQYDLANVIFDEAAFDKYYPTMFLPNKTEWPITERPWNPDQITLLTDGICGSACSLFVEMMTRAGVKTVVAGGRPVTGPMQAASGNRGAVIYGTDDLDYDISFAESIDDLVNENVNATLPAVRDSGIFLNYASINLRDQIRKDEKVPLQFKYEAADCRIYYTLANLYNMTRLWHDVAAAAKDLSLCVEGSTGFSTTNNTNPTAPPAPSAQRPTLSDDNPVVEQIEFEDDPTGGLKDKNGNIKGGSGIVQCESDVQLGQLCHDGQSRCQKVTVTCPNDEGKKPVHACLPPCTCPNSGSCNSCPGQCIGSEQQENKVKGHSSAHVESALFHGLCHPKIGNKKLGCKANPKTT